MKRSILTMICTATFMLIQPFSHALASSDRYSYLEPVPSYAKWGSLAMEETQKKYPQANIVDYLHVGRTELSPTTTQETFKLWLKQGSREWGVFVRITFETNTEKVLSITFQETNRW